MIYLGECDKLKIIKDYIKEYNIKNIFIIGDFIEIEKDIKYEIPTYHKNPVSLKYLQSNFKKSSFINWCSVHGSEFYQVMYYYLQNITENSLLILNEVLTTKNRYCLDYACIRHFCQNKPKILIFNYYPIIDNPEDFMILNDFNSENPFKKEQYKYITKFKDIVLNEVKFEVEPVKIELNEQEIKEYKSLKEKIFREIKKDPGILPRRLLKYSEKCNSKYETCLDAKDKIKKYMKVGVNQTGVDKFYYEKLLNFKRGIEDVKNKIYK